MLLTNKRMSKMSESSIISEYSRYLQKVLIIETEQGVGLWSHFEKGDFMSYEEFKDYYILALVGKDNYIENLAHKIQNQGLIEGA
ncbi:MAG: hypothetical protein DRI71_11505 [Bacteroidetes bacterium]|nr:MAG: hypothetical protein DRI71_11505 [Bacteroidota bacterium]